MADWRLLDYARKAEDAASGLAVFLGEIPQFSKDIAGDIAELFAISSALRTLHEELELRQYGRYSGRIIRDLDVCLSSLSYTLDDVSKMFSESRRSARQHPGAFPGTPPYAQLWEDACHDLREQGMSLPLRLQTYRTYLQSMSDTLRGEPDDHDVANVRARLSRLVKRQEPTDYFSRRAVDPRTYALNGRKGLHISLTGITDSFGAASRTPQPYPPQSSSSSRPHIDRYTTYPAYQNPHPPPLPPRSPGFRHVHPPPPPPPPVHGPAPGPRSSAYGIGDIPFVPPIVPEVPHSPTISTASSHTHSTHSNDSGGPVAHWAMRIFDGRHSATPFQILGQETKCLARDEPQAIEFLDTDGFIKVLELPFEATAVWVRLYWRAEDNRARILFLTLDSNGQRMRYCFPLTGLKILRTQSCLQLCRINRQSAKLDLWANLRFAIYERMVLLFCTMTAMKCQDNVQTPPGLDDYFQPGEKEEFGGEIQDQGYLHAFRIFRDRDSGCVRFETTARRGPQKTIPIWTAFVTQYIGNGRWMKRVSQCTVQFRELHPYMFCDGYRLSKGPSGKYLLTFTSGEDCKNFMDVFHNIRVR